MGIVFSFFWPRPRPPSLEEILLQRHEDLLTYFEFRFRDDSPAPYSLWQQEEAERDALRLDYTVRNRLATHWLRRNA